LPKATSGNLFAGQLDKVAVRIGNGFFLATNRKA
jgi:hypothetical protein